MIHSICDEGNFDVEQQKCWVGAPCNEECYGTGCVETLICKQTGFFPKCTTSCNPHYFTCNASQIGKEAGILTCQNGNVLDPQTMTCINPDDCPF
ncbi:putative Low-density lipoprotein receptor-related protein 8-like 5 [Homarus americanus]|nr:putative Low-density lipoprotein receptor-related protein 8-like 5 [Homarus americanus]